MEPPKPHTALCLDNTPLCNEPGACGRPPGRFSHGPPRACAGAAPAAPCRVCGVVSGPALADTVAAAAAAESVFGGCSCACSGAAPAALCRVSGPTSADTVAAAAAAKCVFGGCCSCGGRFSGSSASSVACTSAALGRAPGSRATHARNRSTTPCGHSSGTLRAGKMS